MKLSNIKQAKELIDTYNMISVKSLPKEIIRHKTIYSITGFGHTKKCTLCKAIRFDCTRCIYKISMGCTRYNNKNTYDRIRYADTPLKLVRAVRARARLIQSIIETLNQ